jgi:hypothetical protein
MVKINFKDYLTNFRIELKRCPFCKSCADFDSCKPSGTGSSGMEAPRWRVKCCGCWVATPYINGDKYIPSKGMINTEREAIQECFKLWNKRA